MSNKENKKVYFCQRLFSVVLYPTHRSIIVKYFNLKKILCM